jgi:hypothetical protein
MTQLSKAAFAVKWNALFVDNNNGEITPTVFRSFVADFIDSFLNLEDHNAAGVADAISKKHEHTSSMQDIEDAVDIMHEHTSSMQDIQDAVDIMHEHSSSIQDIDDAVNKMHEHTDIDALNSIHMIELALQPADILDLKNTPVNFIACPAGYGISIDKAICTLIFDTVQYSCDNFTLQYADGTGLMTISNTLITADETKSRMIKSKLTEEVEINNNVLITTVSDPANGDSILIIRVYYYLVEFS